MKYVSIAAITLLVMLGVGYWSVFRQSAQSQIFVDVATSSRETTSTIPIAVKQRPIAAPTKQQSYPGMKLYRNDEYGFEFWYPEKWQLFIEPHGLGYYSKFHLIAAGDVAESNDRPFLVNVVEPIFADTTFKGVGAASSTVVINGTSGYEYKYDFEGSPEKAIVLPLGKYKVIIGTTKDYMSQFDQMLPTFKTGNF